MFNIAGHKIEICGLHKPSPRDEQVLEAEGLDISDFGYVKKVVERAGEHSITRPSQVAMVVWGEDLARVPLLVYNDNGLIWRAPELTDDHADMLDMAARFVNFVLKAENS